MIATAMETARLYRDRIFALHGLPEEILSDRDSKFISAFWTNLCEMLGTHQNLTTAFRQQANGVTERVNQTIENYLRAFSNANSDDWDELLALAEFTYNSRHQSSISMSPFEADLGYPPITPARWKSVKESKVWNDTAQTLSKEFLEHQQDVLAKARRSLQAAQDRMSNYYDKNRPVHEFKIGDRVLLSTNNLATFHAGTTKKKLGPKWIGPYAVFASLQRTQVPVCIASPPRHRRSPVSEATPRAHSSSVRLPVFSPPVTFLSPPGPNFSGEKTRIVARHFLSASNWSIETNHAFLLEALASTPTQSTFALPRSTRYPAPGLPSWRR
ncbi:unnamed protein product [Phytophthora lilii]|uniref:Unnamed protein product n=1 Tax=Phytophthora lilii TaxID=2077276 RepID=A0A9W6TX65_9STRA|nr:unnamed protein product [Phytophthora lilii]